MTESNPPHPATEAPPLTSAPPATANDDSDPDFDDLDDVLDQFSASSTTGPPHDPSTNAATEKQPSASGPGRPDPAHTAASSAQNPSAKSENENEEDFMARLNAEMAALMSNMDVGGDAPTTSADLSSMGKELEEFTEKMEREGVKPEDLLRAILGDEADAVIDAAHSERDKIEKAEESKEKRSADRAATSGVEAGDPGANASASAASFEDTIRRTMERMSTSDATATSAANQPSSAEEDMLAQLLRALEGEGGGAGNEDGEADLSKMFLGMMEQLTNKDMLYEPMKELDTKFPDWLSQNGSRLSAEDRTRYGNQRRIVGEIVAKFEERGYSDEDSQCREFIWEKMQAMQAEGSPPEDLIANPIPGMAGIPGLGGGDDPGCPTQ